jgi:hypothetical protein
MSKSPAELDPNFQVAKVEDGLAWHALSTPEVEGMGWPSESQSFCRLPDRAQEKVRDVVWQLSRHSAGIAARFFTNATQISARWTVRNEPLGMDHMPASGVSGLDFYARDGERWRWCGVGRATQFPTNQQLIIDGINNENLQGGEREYLLYLPLYNSASEVQIGVPENATLHFAPRAQKPFCFYGTSITHGGCASRPGMSYPAILGRRFNAPHINLGFSGNAWSEPEIADLLAELDPAIFILDPLPNMKEPGIAERLENLIQTLHRAHGSTPIVVVESIFHQADWLTKSTAAWLPNSTQAESRNAELRKVYESLKNEIVGKLYYVKGDHLLGDDGEGTVDGVHPTDVGFCHLAAAIEPAIAQALGDLNAKKEGA